MKKLLLICLVGMSGAAFAQTAAAPAEKAAERKHAADEAKREADELKARAKLDEARARLDKAAREVAELSTQLANEQVRDRVMFIGGERRAVLGVQIDGAKEGARVIRVSPGGPAEEAGVRDGDIIVALDGKPLTGGDDAGRMLVEQMHRVKPDQKVKLRVLRAGRNKDVVVVARPMAFENRVFSVRTGPGTVDVGPMPMVSHFRGVFPGEFGGLELASITPKLGAYFGATEGVLVVQAPKDAALKLEDGDVIQSIDGRKPDDGAHALRILRSYRSGEKLNLGVLRQRKPLTLAVTMPERPAWDERMMGFGMPMSPATPMTPALAIPATPIGGGTFE